MKRPRKPVGIAGLVPALMALLALVGCATTGTGTGDAESGAPFLDGFEGFALGTSPGTTATMTNLPGGVVSLTIAQPDGPVDATYGTRASLDPSAGRFVWVELDVRAPEPGPHTFDISIYGPDWTPCHHTANYTPTTNWQTFGFAHAFPSNAVPDEIRFAIEVGAAAQTLHLRNPKGTLRPSLPTAKRIEHFPMP